MGIIGKTIKYRKDGYHNTEFEGEVIDKIRGLWSSHTHVAVTKYVVHRIDGVVEVIEPQWIKAII